MKFNINEFYDFNGFEFDKGFICIPIKKNKRLPVDSIVYRVEIYPRYLFLVVL